MFHFNPRSREGSDGISAYNTTKAAAISIHAPARGATTHSIANSFLKQHFNPRSREGSDSTLSKIFFVIAKFQSTLPRGERLPTCTRDIQTTFISIHAPARGATASVPPTCVGLQFQSTLPRGERRRSVKFLLYMMSYFNPRSREGSDDYRVVLDILQCIFQSTLPRGERHRCTRCNGLILQISIHAPARGATAHYCQSNRATEFQSTLPRGERLPTCTRDIQTTFISIHAPARGATASVPPTCVGLQFQSTLPRGERPGTPASCHAVMQFQSTLPRGERPILPISSAHHHDISIHAPARGATFLLQYL